MKIKKYGETYLITTDEGFEIEFDKIKIDEEDKQIVLLYEKNIQARINNSFNLYEEFLNKMKN